MPWFPKMSRSSASPEPKPVIGEHACSEHRCLASNAARCSYVDRRNHRCKTAWCPDHQLLLEGKVYCRRHANTLDALGDTEPAFTFGLPDVDNRAPSLVRWICNDIDANVRELLEARMSANETFGRTKVHPVKGSDGVTRWESTWQTFDHTGSRMRVSVEVSESEPERVKIRVGQQVVFGEDPPWIFHRRQNLHVPPEMDKADRETFYRLITQAIAHGVADAEALYADDAEN